MRMPFVLRLKWIRLKSWLRRDLPGTPTSVLKAVWLIFLATIGLGLAWILTACAPTAPPKLAPASDGEVRLATKPAATLQLLEAVPTASTALTPIPTSTPVDTWEVFPAPVEPSAIEVRRPVQPHPNNDRLVTILLLGSDQRPGEYGHRSDVLMLLCIDPAEKTVKLLSIPRDLYVYIPGWRVDRINVADGKGGPAMVVDTILYNFGLEVDHWARIDFDGFIRAVDSLGGIDVEVGGLLSDYCGRYWSYSPGVYHMNGFQALCYVRMRKASSDFDRLRREQEVARALFDRVLSLDGLSRLPDFIEQYQAMIETNASLDDLLPLVPIALEINKDPNRIQSFAIGPDMSEPWRVPASGASVVLPNWQAIGTMLEESFGLPRQSWG